MEKSLYNYYIFIIKNLLIRFALHYKTIKAEMRKQA